MAGEYLQSLELRRAIWYLDAPVSNSGRVARLIREMAREHGWDWEAELVTNPDPLLAAAAEIVASSDSWILDQAHRWFNLTHDLLAALRPSQDVVWLC